MALKPETSITIAAATAVLVYGIFKVEVGASLTDVRSAQPHNSAAKTSINQAAWTSAAVVSGISLLSKDPTIFIVGGAVAAGLIWKYKHANLVHPATGMVTMPPAQGTPAQNQAPSGS